MLASCALVISACAPKNFQALDQISKDTASAIGCSDFESRSWDAVNKYLIEQQLVPTAEELKDHLRVSLKELRTAGGTLPSEKTESLAKEIDALYDILLTDAPQSEKVQDSQGLLSVLSALEIGDHTTESKVRLQEKVTTQFARIKSQVAAMGVQCGTPEPTPTPPGSSEEPSLEPGLEKIITRLPLPIYGVRFAMATAYQTCQALTEPIMTKSTPDIEDDAIKIVGTHPDGVGKLREIASVTGLLRSHPYYKNVNNYGSQCLNGRSYPMIYDYGGKPYATTGLTSTLNFFKDSGDGTKTLGTDCSGFIYTALATAGLRIAPGREMKASGVNGVSSTMYVEPQKNGLSCMAKITVTPKSDLKAGDIVAVQGHVLMIDSVGSDPFGLNGIKTADGCSKIEAKNFDFAVIQSSPSKNAAGINRYQAKDYLYESDKMRDTLEKYAYYSCLARVNNKNYTPSLGTGSVIRHSLSSDCMGTRIRLAQEACIQKCPQLAQ
jgi:hypothetical protein